MTKTLIGSPDPDDFSGGILAYTPNNTQKHIIDVCDDIKKMLLEKNRKYGDSAINPIRVFSKANTKEQLAVRIDDKLNRKMNNQLDDSEDIDSDLIGYLILRKVYDKLHGKNT